MIESLLVFWRVFVCGQLIVGVIWAVRQEGRINQANQRVDDLEKLINVRFDGVDGRLERIERSMNGFLHKN